jgi:hypothetical protein
MIVFRVMIMAIKEVSDFMILWTHLGPKISLFYVSKIYDLQKDFIESFTYDVTFW